jgi:hypothetical protein
VLNVPTQPDGFTVRRGVCICLLYRKGPAAYPICPCQNQNLQLRSGQSSQLLRRNGSGDQMETLDWLFPKPEICRSCATTLLHVYICSNTHQALHAIALIGQLQKQKITLHAPYFQQKLRGVAVENRQRLSFSSFKTRKLICPPVHLYGDTECIPFQVSGDTENSPYIYNPQVIFTIDACYIEQQALEELYNS